MENLKRRYVPGHTSGSTNMLWAPMVLLLSSVLLACGGDDSGVAGSNGGNGGGGGTATVSFKSIQDSVFTPSCSSCHGSFAPSAGLSLVAGNSYASLVGIGSSQQGGADRVIAGDADNSYLIKKLEGSTGIVGAQMPLNGGPLPAATIQTIRDWINAGALDN